MNNYYKKYLNAFLIFARTTYDRFSRQPSIVQFALSLHKKSEQLIRRASKNSHIYIMALSKDFADLGRRYIRKYSERFRNNPESARKESFTPGRLQGESEHDGQ